MRRLRRDGIIRPSTSGYAAPICPVRKSDGSLRLCVDYRQLNGKTKDTAIPTGNLQEVIESLSGAKFFNILHLARGYFQVPIVEKDKKKRAFRTPSGLYVFNRMPFGLEGAPATFCRMMSLGLGHLTPIQLVLYMDNLCIVSDTFRLHLDRLEQAFTTLHKHVLRLNAKKRQFVTTQAIFCGFHISAEGINPDLEKVTAIERIPTPTTVKEVKIFLGITGFYHRFIPRYATFVAPLTSMLVGEQSKSKLHFTPYSVGDLVWITRPSGGKQVSRSFCPRGMGPYKVVKKISDVVYKVRRPYGRKDVTLHHDRIKPYVHRNLRFKNIRTDVNQQGIFWILKQM